MKTSAYITEIADSLASGKQPNDFADVFVTILRELAAGRPVSPESLAKTLDLSSERVNAVLNAEPGIDYDDEGSVVGYGLTLRETPHVFEVEGRRLHTWCALDTLIFPALIGKNAHVFSRCAHTGKEVSLMVTPEGLLDVNRTAAMVSLLRPDPSVGIRDSFCCHVHFFASPSAASSWASMYPGVEAVPVEAASRLGQEIAAQILKNKEKGS